MNKPKFETPDMTQKNIDKISQLFPNCIEYEIFAEFEKFKFFFTFSGSVSRPYNIVLNRSGLPAVGFENCENH